MTKAVLFDLDGTLVDSAPAIIDAFRWVLDARGVAPKAALDQSLIGPPLRDTLQRITGELPGPLVDELAAAFRDRYDAVVAGATPPYPGAHAVLESLQRDGFALFIVTNKRIVPTRLIVAALGLTDAFAGVYSPDALEPRAPDKPSLVSHVVRAHALTPAASVFVGDTPTDARAAAANGIPFVAARYGYGDPGADGDPVAASIDALAELPAAVARVFS